MIQFYGYSKCDACKKAKKFLIENKIDFEEIELTEKTPSKELLRATIEKEGSRKVFNTSGKVYRDRKLSSRLPDLTKEDMVELILDEGMLLKRPFVIAKGEVLLGFKENEWKEKLH